MLQTVFHAEAVVTQNERSAVTYDSYVYIDDQPSFGQSGLFAMALFFFAVLAGDRLFAWFMPSCGADVPLVIAGFLAGLGLMFRQPMLALLLAFGIGDPVVDVYGHCLLGM